MGYQTMMSISQEVRCPLELWFRSATLTRDILFESGSTSSHATSLAIDDTTVSFNVTPNGVGSTVNLSFDLDTLGIDPRDEFVQLVGTIDLDPTNIINFYLNGILVDTHSGTAITDWTNPFGAGLADEFNGSNLPGNYDRFEGHIAIFNLYGNDALDPSTINPVLTGDEVLDNYRAIAGFSVTDVNGIVIDGSSSLLSPINLDNGDLLIAPDGSYQYTPDTGFTGVETFTYGITALDGETDTANVIIAVGDDVIAGTFEDDTISGTTGDDQLYGLSGNDILTGDSGIDTFVWGVEDHGTIALPDTDTVTDFTVGAGGDVLEFSDVLIGEESGVLEDYFTSITYDGSDTTIEIDTDGDGSGTDLEVVLLGLDITPLGVSTGDILQQLLDDNNLVIDL